MTVIHVHHCAEIYMYSTLINTSKFCKLKGRNIGIAEKAKEHTIWYALDAQVI